MRARRMLLSVLAAVVVLAGAACSSDDDSSSSDATTTTTPRLRLDDTLRLDQVQMLASHNSYHVKPEPPVLEAIKAVSAAEAIGLDYTHAPLTTQFDESGVRAIELDAWYDPDGGLYAKPYAPDALELDYEQPPEMSEPGFKVFHVQDLDYVSRCYTLVECLKEVKAWSDAHPGHVPMMIQLELKDDTVPAPDAIASNFVVPKKFNAAALDALDAEIRTVFDDDEMITPDFVRGDAETLGAAVAENGWPTLAESRGKVLFTMDNLNLRELYVKGHPSLEGRVLFTPSEPGKADGAFAKLNDPVADKAAIAKALAAHMLVRTRADADTLQSRTNDTKQRDAALASGAQFVSTDYEVADERFSDYSVAIPDGTPARCNPVTAPADCKPTDIEDPAHLTG